MQLLNPGYLASMKIELVEVGKLKVYRNNPRKHSKQQINQLANSMTKLNFFMPVVIDNNNVIVAGHGRIEAAKQIGLKLVPTIRAEHLTDEQIRLYRLADNKIAQNATWDESLLRIELSELVISSSIDIEVTGFQMAEIDIIIGDAPTQSPDDTIPEVDDATVVTKKGDIWILGKHILICGDSTVEETYRRLMGKALADMVLTDPPYNVPISGHVCGLGKNKHREFAQASGEMTDVEFEAFLKSYMTLAAKFSKDGSIHYHFIDWRGCRVMLSAGTGIYTVLKNICIWNKDNGGMGSLYRSKHEMVLVFKNGTKPHTNNIKLGKYGNYRTNVWDYPGVNSMKKDRAKELEMHPTVKPVEMLADAIKDCSKRGDVILDPFGGSGSTLIAAEKAGRCARLIELDEKYCDVIVKRFQEATGVDAVHAETKLTFNQLLSEKSNG